MHDEDPVTCDNTFLISIVWVGYSLDGEFGEHKQFLAPKEEEFEMKVTKGSDASLYHQWMELTAYGEPICINEYASRIAALKSVHVLQLCDFKSENPYNIREEHIDYSRDFYELVLDERPGR